MRILNSFPKKAQASSESINHSRQAKDDSFFSKIDDSEKVKNTPKRSGLLNLKNHKNREAGSGSLKQVDDSKNVSESQTKGLVKIISDPDNIPFFKRSKKLMEAAKEWDQATKEGDDKAIRAAHKKGSKAIAGLTIEGGLIITAVALTLLSAGTLLPAASAGTAATGATTAAASAGAAASSLTTASVVSSTASSVAASTSTGYSVASGAASVFATANKVQKSENRVAKVLKRVAVGSLVNQPKVQKAIEGVFKLLIKPDLVETTVSP